MAKHKRKKKPSVNPITKNLDDYFRRAVDDIVRILSRIATRSHHRVDRVFEDWLQMVDDALAMMPLHAVAVMQTGELADDPPEIKARFDRIADTYRHALDKKHNFARAMSVLLESAQTGYFDVVGTVYMAINAENRYAGQYFTPWPVAQMMAQILVGDSGPVLVIERLMAAADAAANAPDAPPGLKAARLMGRLAALRDNFALRRVDFPDADFPDWLMEYWTSIAPHYKPVTIDDPAIGSGVMMVAAASLFPRWMLYLGLVQFYGSDIDETCVRMARVNAKLYGLNGFGGRMMLALNTPQIRKGEENESNNPQLALAAASGDRRDV